MQQLLVSGTWTDRRRLPGGACDAAFAASVSAVVKRCGFAIVAKCFFPRKLKKVSLRVPAELSHVGRADEIPTARRS